ncbi:MAG: PAS domain-containing protein, partial [Sphingomonadales bacterium]|nr:PAS domain-containing protein [Sphingomonadales bacterium]
MNMLARRDDFFVPADRLDYDGDLGVYKTLLESTNAIPWKIDWATMRFEYIGPQIEPLLGWTQDSWISVEDWSSRMHPDDRENVVNFCVSQSMAGIDHEADYRALTRDNGYVWIRDVVHVVRNDAGDVECLVGFMFDISERKKIEQELLGLQKKLETLSFEDGLTG